MSSLLSKSAQKVQDILSEKGVDFKVIELSESTRTAQQAADAIGCTVGQIIKSLIFQTKKDKKPLLFLVSGINKVDEAVVANTIGEAIERAKPDFVREVTGFAIGGIPPVGHTQLIKTYIDEDLLSYDELWAAAGTPHAVFNIRDLESLIDGGTLIAVHG